MTKKDYVLIANALRRTKPSQGNVIITNRRDRYHTGKVMQHGLVCEALSNALARENPLFDRALFTEAIGNQ